MNGQGNDDSQIYPLTAVRTCRVRGEPETVILAVTSCEDTRHYSMQKSDFMRLVQQMRHDAALLAGGEGGRAS